MGAEKQRSTAWGIWPPDMPVKPKVMQPILRAFSMARNTLGELPEVERPMTTSPERAMASTCRSKMFSKP